MNRKGIKKIMLFLLAFMLDFRFIHLEKQRRFRQQH